MVAKIIGLWICAIVICFAVAIFCAFPIQITCGVILSWWIAKQIKKHKVG
jgi:uncharacterized membrane protein